MYLKAKGSSDIWSLTLGVLILLKYQVSLIKTTTVWHAELMPSWNADIQILWVLKKKGKKKRKE